MVAIEWIHPEPVSWQPYSAEVTAALPLRHLSAPDPVVAAVREAGFIDVQALRLESVEQAERETSEDSSEAPERYAVVGHKPSA